MSLRSFKVLTGELVSNFVDKYNRLVDQIIFNVRVEDNKMKFYTADRVIVVDLPATGTGTGTGGGTPEDNEYVSNNFISDGDPYNKVISDLDAILGALSPATAETLSGKDVPYNGELVFFRARLSAGMGAEWYTGPAQAGSLIDRYTTDNTYTLYTPGSAFRAGSKNAPTGNLLHMLDGSQYVTLPVSAAETTRSFTSAAGTSLLKVSSSVFNGIWQKGTGSVNYTQARAGYAGHSFKNTDTEGNSLGETNAFRVWYDNQNSAPSFASPITSAPVSTQLKYLSGIGYYGRNSTVSVNSLASTYSKTVTIPITSALSARRTSATRWSTHQPPLRQTQILW